MFFVLILTICTGADCKVHTLPEHYATIKECRAAKAVNSDYAAYKLAQAKNPNRTFMFQCERDTGLMDQVTK